LPSSLLMMYPIRHTVNVMVAVLLGTRSAVGVAFMIGLLRFLTGTSSLLGFPGRMIGAFCTGLLYRKFQKSRWAGGAEIIGTEVISSLFTVSFSKYVMGISHGAFFFMPSFMISSVAGALIGWVLLLKVQPAVLR